MQGELFTVAPLRFLPAGDTAMTVELGDAGAAGVSGRVLDLYQRVREAELPGIVDVVPAIRSLTVHYDPLQTSNALLRGLIERWARPTVEGASEMQPGARRWTIPACYAPELGPDVHEVAEKCGLAPWQVTALHACVVVRVVMVGFLPGQPYLGDLPPPLRLPRRDNPRIAVPAGSIAIAGVDERRLSVRKSRRMAHHRPHAGQVVRCGAGRSLRCSRPATRCGSGRSAGTSSTRWPRRRLRERGRRSRTYAQT